MKYIITAFLCCIFLQVIACCNTMNGNTGNMLHTESMKLRITVGNNTFTASLYNNATASAFKAKLPMTINMHELNSNEKYFDLPDNLSANAPHSGAIQAGDLMLYGSNTMVLFYKTFTTTYRYTPMAHIDDTAGLTAALGSTNVTVTFSLSPVNSHKYE